MHLDSINILIGDGLRLSGIMGVSSKHFGMCFIVNNPNCHLRVAICEYVNFGLGGNLAIRWPGLA